MNCLNQSSGLWILIILLLLGGTNILSSKAFTGCGWPILAALAYCMLKNGTLSNLISGLNGNNGCGCNG